MRLQKQEFDRQIDQLSQQMKREIDLKNKAIKAKTKAFKKLSEAEDWIEAPEERI